MLGFCLSIEIVKGNDSLVQEEYWCVTGVSQALQQLRLISDQNRGKKKKKSHFFPPNNAQHLLVALILTY